MKLSKREKTLISILILVVIAFFVYKFVPYDKIFKLAQLEGGYDQIKSTYDNMSLNILMKSDGEKDMQELTNEINDTNMLADIKQENIIVFLNSYLTNSKIDTSAISFSEVTPVAYNTTVNDVSSSAKSSLELMMDQINGNQNSLANASNDSNGNKNAEASSEAGETQENGDEAQVNLSTVNQISVNITFESSYKDMLSFIDAIQNNPINISITNINTVSKEGDIIQGIITLNFYELPKLDGYVEKNNDWIWKDLIKSGKINPFQSDGGTYIASSESNKEDKFDFYVSLKPETSDLPTVIVGKAEDKNRTTYVYADSNVLENIEFQFKKENSKFYYKYSTKNEKFPSDGTWLDFTPAGSDIKIMIYSSQRNSKTDSAGANIAITNTSGLKIRFGIEDDDKINPRVYFKDPKSVIVTRK